MKIWITIISLLGLLAGPVLHAQDAAEGDKQDAASADGNSDSKGDAKSDKDNGAEEEPDCD